MQLVLTPALILQAYRQGLFPMAYSAESHYVHWVCPDMRGQLSITNMHIPRKLKKTVLQSPYEIRINTAFRAVMEACAQTAETRPETWINEQILEGYETLHKEGHAHSVECWQDGALMGGLYGLAIGGAFFGESMFARARDASKIALVHLAARLYAGDFCLLDTQFINDHLRQFGVYEIEHQEYLKLLTPALEKKGNFNLCGVSETTLLEKYFNMRAENNS